MLEEGIKEAKRHNDILLDYACPDSEAIYFNPREDDFLPPFFSDADKIVNSTSYSRYMGKPQVFTQNTNEHIQNRMIHVQLVNRVSRMIGIYLGLNDHLLEAASLGHDTGHVPFGHEGEYILDDISRSIGEGYFNHNVQSVRNLMILENHGRGLNVSVQVLDAILCHNSKCSSLVYEPCVKTKEEFLEEYYSSYQDKRVLKEIKPMTLEGCVLRVSDLIAYLGRDIDDAIRYHNLFSWEQVPSEIREILGSSREELVRTCISDIVNNSFNKPYIAFSDKVYEAIMHLLKVNTDHIYHNYLQPGEKEHMELMYTTLFNSYLAALNKREMDSSVVQYFDRMSPSYQKETSNERVALDYIAGMTTRYFKNEYNKELVRTRKKD